MHAFICLANVLLHYSTFNLLAFCASPEPTALDTGITTMVLVPGRALPALAALTVTVVGFEPGAAVTITFPFTLVFPVLDRTISVVVLDWPVSLLFSNVWAEVGVPPVAPLLIIIGFVSASKLLISMALLMSMNCKKRKLG